MHTSLTSGQTSVSWSKKDGFGRETTLLLFFFWKLSKRGRFLFCPGTEKETETDRHRETETERQRQKESKERQQCGTLEEHARALYKDIPGFRS